MRGEIYEKRENPQKAAWQKVYQEVERIVDKLGKPVDPGIKESVVALRVLGLETQASCEGHLDRGVKGPWIDVGPEIPQALKDRMREQRKHGGHMDPELENKVGELKIKNLEDQLRLMGLLEEFYNDRNVPLERRLILKFYPYDARLISQGAELQDLYRPEVQREKLKEFQKEMAAFTKFVKEKYFSQR